VKYKANVFMQIYILQQVSQLKSAEESLKHSFSPHIKQVWNFQVIIFQKLNPSAQSQGNIDFGQVIRKNEL
jgi:type II secretory pathway component PulL